MNTIDSKYKIILLVFVPLILFTACQYLYSDSKAKLEIEEPIYDFGIVAGDTVLTHTFSLANVGGDTLYIKGVRSTWGCTASLLSSEVIPPGEKGDLRVTFSTKKRWGENKKAVYIYSTDEKSRLTKVYIKANVVKK